MLSSKMNNNGCKTGIFLYATASLSLFGVHGSGEDRPETPPHMTQVASSESGSSDGSGTSKRDSISSTNWSISRSDPEDGNKISLPSLEPGTEVRYRHHVGEHLSYGMKGKVTSYDDGSGNYIIDWDGTSISTSPKDIMPEKDWFPFWMLGTTTSMSLMMSDSPKQHLAKVFSACTRNGITTARGFIDRIDGEDAEDLSDKVFQFLRDIGVLATSSTIAEQKSSELWVWHLVKKVALEKGEGPWTALEKLKQKVDYEIADCDWNVRKFCKRNPDQRKWKEYALIFTGVEADEILMRYQSCNPEAHKWSYHVVYLRIKADNAEILDFDTVLPRKAPSRTVFHNFESYIGQSFPTRFTCLVIPAWKYNHSSGIANFDKMLKKLIANRLAREERLQEACEDSQQQSSEVLQKCASEERRQKSNEDCQQRDTRFTASAPADTKKYRSQTCSTDWMTPEQLSHFVAHMKASLAKQDECLKRRESRKSTARGS